MIEQKLNSNPYRVAPLILEEFKVKELKQSSIYAKFAVMITVVLATFLITIYYIGILRAVTLLWQILIFFLVGIVSIMFLPVVVYKKIFGHKIGLDRRNKV